jgi:hypothetical protein
MNGAVGGALSNGRPYPYSCFSFFDIVSDVRFSYITIVLLRIIVDKLSLLALELFHLGALEFV